MLLEQLAHEPPGCVPVAAALHQYVEHRTVLVTVRHSQCFLPLMVTTTSSRCHLSPRASAVGRMRRAIPRPDFTDQRRTVS